MKTQTPKQIDREQRKTLDLGALLPEDIDTSTFPEDFQKDAYLGHLSAFDYNHPVNNLLHRLGIKDYDAFHKIVENGTQIIPTPKLREIARSYIDHWSNLIQNRKNGVEVTPLRCLFGVIQPEYDRARLDLEKDRREGFEQAVRSLCAIAEYNPEEMLSKMLGEESQ
jgi:hypothetical protein